MKIEFETSHEMLEEFFEDMDFGAIFLSETDAILKLSSATEKMFKKKIKTYEDLPNKLKVLIQERKSFEKRVMARKGKIFYVMQKVLIKNEVFRGTILIIQDITKTQLEEDIRLKEISQEREILARLISHEVRNSLNLISGFGQLMKESEDMLFIKKNLKIIFDETTRINRFVQDVLSFTKDEELMQEEFDLVSMLDEILMFTEGAEIIDLFSDASEVYLVGDKDKLKQVFLNLINNGLSAIENLNNKIFKIVIHEFDEKIEIDFVTSYDEKKEIKTEKLFKPYFTTKNTGSGLGLSICRKLVKEHKGEIFAKKNQYHGLTFKIVLKKSKNYKIVEKSDDL